MYNQAKYYPIIRRLTMYENLKINQYDNMDLYQFNVTNKFPNGFKQICIEAQDYVHDRIKAAKKHQVTLTHEDFDICEKLLLTYIDNVVFAISFLPIIKRSLKSYNDTNLYGMPGKWVASQKTDAESLKTLQIYLKHLSTYTQTLATHSKKLGMEIGIDPKEIVYFEMNFQTLKDYYNDAFNIVNNLSPTEPIASDSRKASEKSTVPDKPVVINKPVDSDKPIDSEKTVDSNKSADSNKPVDSEKTSVPGKKVTNYMAQSIFEIRKITKKQDKDINQAIADEAHHALIHSTTSQDAIDIFEKLIMADTTIHYAEDAREVKDYYKKYNQNGNFSGKLGAEHDYSKRQLQDILACIKRNNILAILFLVLAFVSIVLPLAIIFTPLHDVIFSNKIPSGGFLIYLSFIGAFIFFLYLSRTAFISKKRNLERINVLYESVSALLSYTHYILDQIDLIRNHLLLERYSIDKIDMELGYKEIYSYYKKVYYNLNRLDDILDFYETVGF